MTVEIKVRKIIRCTVCLPVMALLFMSVCPAVAAGPVSLQDDRGQTITLAHPAQRIIALSPHLVENVFSAGAGSKLVGVVSYSNYPSQAKKLPQVGSYKTISLETIAALHPDLVLVWGSGNGAQVVQQLERLGIKVYVNEPRQLTDIASTVRAIGHLAGTEAVSEKAARQYLQQLTSLRERFSNAAPVSVFYQVWNNPLQTLNGKHLISGVIRLCGGRNIYADAPSIAPKINIESVLHRNPDVIVASGMGEQRPEWLDEWQQYPTLNAVKYDNLYYVPPDLIQRYTLRILQGAKNMCEHLAQARKKLNRVTKKNTPGGQGHRLASHKLHE